MRWAVARRSIEVKFLELPVLGVHAAQWTTPDRLKPAVRANDAVAALRLELRCLPDVRFDTLELDTLRLYLDGDSALVYTLYELLSNNLVRILVRETGTKTPKSLVLGPEALRPVGFAQDEGMLPYPRRSFLGYRLLQEYFTFPEKYLFLDLAGFDGMLFKFTSDYTGEFYMKDTPLPLSIAFFDASGQFVSTVDMAPCIHMPSCPTYGAARPYRWALEVPQGALPRLAIGPGTRLVAGGPCP